jgi:hypothetical protein
MDVLDVDLIKFPRLGPHPIWADKIDEIGEAKEAEFIVFASALEGLFPQNVLINRGDNEVGLFLMDIPAGEEQFFEAADMVGVGMSNMIIVKIGDFDAFGVKRSRNIGPDIH